MNCPSCGAPTEEVDRQTFMSTSGLCSLVKVRCPLGHWFTIPTYVDVQ